VLFELGARPHPPRELYRAYLAQSDVFIGLYWQRYGQVNPGMAVSGLEEEFELAGGVAGTAAMPTGSTPTSRVLRADQPGPAHDQPGPAHDQPGPAHDQPTTRLAGKAGGRHILLRPAAFCT